jgi:hypothetical protein
MLSNDEKEMYLMLTGWESQVAVSTSNYPAGKRFWQIVIDPTIFEVGRWRREYWKTLAQAYEEARYKDDK